MRPTTIVIAAPFKSSNLAIPPSPFSPRLPITPPATPPPQLRRRSTFLPTRPPPTEPLPWVWQCHVCHHTYPLSTTRRCLEDGHRFCSGTTTVKRRGRSGKLAKKHKACASEFDYQGWDIWGDWRREEQVIHLECKFESNSTVNTSLSPIFERKTNPKDCWNNCNYPSECRWGKRFAKAVKMDEPPSPPETPSPPPPLPPPITFDNILGIFGEVSSPNTSGKEESLPQNDKDDFWSVLLYSASRRKSTASAGETPLVSSPLTLNHINEDLEVKESSPNSKSRNSITESPKLQKRSSFEVKSVRKVIHDPLIPVASEPIFQIPSHETSLDFLIDGPLMLNGFLAEEATRHSSSVGKNLEKKRNGHTSYVERMRKHRAS